MSTSEEHLHAIRTAIDLFLKSPKVEKEIEKIEAYLANNALDLKDQRIKVLEGLILLYRLCRKVELNIQLKKE